MWNELLTLPDHLSSPPVFSGVRITRSLVLCACFLNRRLSFFFWPLCRLSFDLRILITPLGSSNSSINPTRCVYFIFFRNNKDNNLQVLSGHVVIVLIQAASDTVKILFLSVKRNIIWEVIVSGQCHITSHHICLRL